jgi:hypothetical protein
MSKFVFVDLDSTAGLISRTCCWEDAELNAVRSRQIPCSMDAEVLPASAYTSNVSSYREGASWQIASRPGARKTHRASG